MTDSASAPQTIGRYAIYDAIGSGGMASVHFGRLTGAAGFARTVAIKRLHPHMAHDTEFRAMFIDEARLAARIRHPNVVPTLDVVYEDDELFLVMEYVQGEALSRLQSAAAARRQRPPADVAIAILTNVLHGLHAAHEAKDEQGVPLELVHRDVTPHNILVGSDGAARVLDFGIAKASGRLQQTRAGQAKGKFAYMAPEQLAARSVDRRADVYGASIVLWELLTGTRLFGAESDATILSKALQGCSQPPGALVRGLDPRLDAIVMRGLAPRKERRYPTALEMALALEELRMAAPASVVGRWVRELGAEAIDKRARRIAEIEGEPEPPSDAAPVNVPPRASWPDRPAPGEERTGNTSSSSSPPNAPVPRETSGAHRTWTWLVGSVAIGIVAAVALAMRHGTLPEDSTPTVSVPTVSAPADPTQVLELPSTPGSTDTHAPSQLADRPPPEATASATKLDGPDSGDVKGAKTQRRTIAPAASAPADCQIPVWFDEQGFKHYKRGCLQR